MKWVLIPVAVLGAAVLLVLVIGALLPRNHVASTKIVVTGPPEEVYRLISDVESAASWRDVRKVEMLGTAPRRWREHGKFGPITYEAVEATPPFRFVTRIADTDQGFGGTWTFAITPVPSGTEVRITEDGFVSNPVFRFMSRFVFGQHGAQEAYLRAIAKKVGGDAAPIRVT